MGLGLGLVWVRVGARHGEVASGERVRKLLRVARAWCSHLVRVRVRVRVRVSVSPVSLSVCVYDPLR